MSALFRCICSANEAILCPGAIALDPRVVPLTFVPTARNRGHYTANITIVLSPVRPAGSEREPEGVTHADQTASPVSPVSLDLSGFWSDSDGGVVKVENHGHTFSAVEYPHSRKWGTVAGYLYGNTIVGVDFRNGNKLIDDFETDISLPPWDSSMQKYQIADIAQLPGLLKNKVC